MQQATNLRVPPPPKPSDASATSTSTAGPPTAGPSTAGPSTTAANTIDLTAQDDAPQMQFLPLVEARERGKKRDPGDKLQPPRDIRRMLLSRGILKLFSTSLSSALHIQHLLRRFEQHHSFTRMKNLVSKGWSGSASRTICSSGVYVCGDGGRNRRRSREDSITRRRSRRILTSTFWVPTSWNAWKGARFELAIRSMPSTCISTT